MTVLAYGKSVFFDQLVQLTSEENGVVQPDVQMWLLMVDRSQAAALDLPQKQCPQVGAGPGQARRQNRNNDLRIAWMTTA